MNLVMFFLNNRGLTISAYITVFFLLLPFGCSREGEGGKSVKKDMGKEAAVVAKVGDNNITVSDFKSYLSDRPMPYRSQASLEDLEERLDAMVLQEVLYQEALRLKLDQDPQMRGRIRQMLSQKLIDEQIDLKVWDRDIGDKELQEYYDNHRDEFNRPEQVRLADIFIAVPEGASEEQKFELRKEAEAVLGEALEARGKRTGFGNLVRKYSEAHEVYGRGDTGFFDREGKPRGIDKRLAEEAFRLERVGSMAEQVIETSDGYHIIMLIGKRSAIHRPLDRVRDQLKQRMRREALAEAREAYFEGLKEQARIEKDSQVMAGILEDLNKSAQSKYAISKNNKTPKGGGSVGPPAPFQREGK